MFLEHEVVGGCFVVVLVGLQALLAILCAESEVSEFAEDGLVDRNLVVPNKDPRRQLLCHLLEPRVSLDLFDSVAAVWVGVQDVFEEVFGFRRYEFGRLVLAIQYFFVKLCSVWVFERQIPADHREQDHTTAPDVHS